MTTKAEAPPTNLVRNMLLCNGLTVVAVMPAFLLGAMSLEIRRDIAIGPSEVGTAVGVMFTVSAISARLLGALVQRIGHCWAMALSGSLSATTLILCGSATGLPWLMWTFALGGLANGTAHPAVNETIAKTMPANRHGLAFGIKQSSIPATTLCCAMAVPAVAPELGWRVAFWFFAALAVLLTAASLILRPKRDHGPSELDQRTSATGEHSLSAGRMILIAVVAGAGMAAATSLGVFLIPTGVQVGLDVKLSALIGAFCSIACIGIRVGLGWSLDRFAVRNEYMITSAFLILGSTGYVLLTFDSKVAFIVGAAVAYGIGWGWTGLMQASVVRDNRSRVASATGALTVGTSLGAALGPFVFGRVADSYSYNQAWFIAAALSLTAGLTLALSRARAR